MNEVKPMEEKKVRSRRDWVKNALIVFLTVMLVLTFFSNTIMNYSLPEVAAQYPQSTTITTKIRGSGTVEAAQSYNVTVSETRTIAAVNVKAGDTITAGQKLLTLDAMDSQELQDAKTSYETLKLEYDKQQIQMGEQTNASNASLQQLKDTVSQAESDLADAQKYEASLKSYQDAEQSAQNTLNSKQQALATANTNLSLLQAEKENMASTDTGYMAAQDRVTAAQEALMAAMEEEGDTSAAQAELDAAQNALNQYTVEISQKIANAQTAQINAQAAVDSAQSALTAAQTATSQFQADNPNAMSATAAEAALKSAKDALAAAEAAAADEKVQKEYDDAVAALDKADLEKRLKEAEEKVKTLEAKTSASEIVARFGGVVTEVNVAAGDTTTPDTPLMVVEMTEKGYTLTASVTKAQAKTLREGLTAEITNLWNSGITMTLSSIATDKDDPSGSKKLTFTLQGEDISVGQNISFSVGDKNASYDVVLPTAAIHSDADGSFVYTVTAKSSPLGNRYTVKKKTVTVLASDDVSSAVTGDLSTADFVITTSTVPIEVGDQVRIAE